MSLDSTLLRVFNSNFVAYYRSHMAHVNIMGRNFYSDHKLLQKVYESLQSDIDTIAEFLRTINEFMPESLGLVIADSDINDDDLFGSAEELLIAILSNLTELTALYRELEEAAEDEDQDQIANFAQDRIAVLEKFSWMLRSTLD